VGASDATLGWAFRGQRIVRTAITQLVKSHGMGATAGQRLLFGGCVRAPAASPALASRPWPQSAGAIGAMNSLDAVSGLTLACEGAGAGLPACTASGLTVQGFLDGAALVDIRACPRHRSPTAHALPPFSAQAPLAGPGPTT